MKPTLFVAFLILAMVAVDVGAQTDDPKVSRRLAKLTAKIPELEIPVITYDETPGPPKVLKPEIDWNIGATVRCTVRQEMADPVDVLFPAEDNLSAIWPGSLVAGGSLQKGTLRSISSPRRPGRLVFHGLPGPTVSVDVENPAKATIEQAIREMLPNKPFEVKGRIEYVVKEVSSEEEMAYKLGIGLAIGKTWGIDLKTTFGELHRYKVAKFTQVFYSVFYEYPGEPLGFFSDLDKDTLSDWKKDPPVFISQVDYGRSVFAVIESETSVEDIAASVGVVIRSIGITPGIQSTRVGTRLRATQERWLRRRGHQRRQGSRRAHQAPGQVGAGFPRR